MVLLATTLLILCAFRFKRSERFAQGGPRGMGPGNQGYGRVREEFDGPSKKPRF